MTEFYELVQSISPHSLHSQILWRGQSSIDWTVNSSMRREVLDKDFIGRNSELKDTIDRLNKFENQLINSSKSRKYHIQNGQVLSDLELLALLQHYGAKTRLIDFTLNMFTALWFAVSEDYFPSYESVSVLVGLRLAKNKYKHVVHGDLSQSVQTMISNNNNNIFIFRPSSIIERIQLQQSVFVFSADTDFNHTSLNVELSDYDKNLDHKDNSMFAIAINNKMKNEIASTKLFHTILGINRQNLFPEIDDFAKNYNFNLSITVGGRDGDRFDIPDIY